jgi:glycosyltransferase involved in cell wall biosynthesis
VIAGDQSRIRVCLIVGRLSKIGGIPVVLRRFLNRFDVSRFEITVIQVRPILEADGLADLAGRVAFESLEMTRESSLGKRLRGMVMVRRIVRRLRPDVVWAMNGVAWLTILAPHRRTPVLIDIIDPPEAKRSGRLKDWLEGFLLRHFGYKAVVHTSPTATAVSRAHRVHPSSLLHSQFGAEAAFDRNDGTDVPALSEQPPSWVVEGRRVVLWVGRLVPSKRPGDVIDIAAIVRQRCPPTHFVVIGDGPLRGTLEHKVRSLDLADTVVFAGVHTGDIRAVYRYATMLLSTSEYEGFGLVIAEAMSAGLPVISTDAGGVTDLVLDGETGLLCAVGDVAAAAAAIERIVIDDNLARELGGKARERIKSSFTLEAETAGYEAVLECAARHRRSRRERIHGDPLLGGRSR